MGSLFSGWYDRTLNREQQQAVTNIVAGTSKPAPYLIFGPPGTGKTVTTTEAIRQVWMTRGATRHENNCLIQVVTSDNIQCSTHLEQDSDLNCLSEASRFNVY
ncbi:MAG: AAA domain-containing protein [Sedimenticola sp.]